MLPYSGIPALPKNIEDMHNQLVTLGLNDVEAITKRIQKCEVWVASVEETEQTGNPVEYQDALALPAKSLTVELEPIQDLHGYDKPWVGGAGKNKLPLTLANIKTINITGTWNGNVYTVNSGTFEVLVDSANNVTGIKVNGTFTANSEIKLTVATYANNDYKGKIINGCANGSADTYNILTTYSSNGTSWAAEMSQYGNTDKTISSDYDYIRFSVFVKANTEVSNIVIYPMIRNSGESATFAPYSNICPISGRTDTTVTVSDGDETSADFTISLGQTVYGGSVDFTTGAARVTWASKTLGSDAGTAYGFRNYWESSTTWTKYMGRTGQNIGNALEPSQTSMGVVMSDCFHMASDDTRSVPNSVSASSSVDDAIYLNFGEDSGLDTTAKQLAWLAQHPVQICYKLKTPLELTLTPTEVQMLKGYNSVSSDDGDITLTAYTGDPWEAVTRAIKKVTKKTANKKSKKGGK